MIYLEYLQAIKQHILLESQREILAKIKKRNDASTHFERFTTAKKFKEGDALIVEGVEIRKDGTIWTKLKNRKECIRGFAEFSVVNETSCYKSVLPRLIKNFRNIGILKAIITLLAVKWNVGVISQYFATLFNSKELLLKDEHWSAPVKEIRRVLLKYIDQYITDAIALVVEYDSAYRYRMQDVIVNLNKDNLRGFKIIGEMGRLFDILISREPMDYDQTGQKVSEMVKKFTRIKILLQIGMTISIQFRKLIRNILQDLDIDKVKMTKEDLYWTRQIGSYNYEGLSKAEREQLNIQNYGAIH